MQEFGSITITGLNELGQRLAVFSDKVSNQITREAAKDAIKVFREGVRFNMKRDYKSLRSHWLGRGNKKVFLNPGNLIKQVRFKAVKNMPKGTVRFEVYVKSKIGWYFKFVERGTSKMQAIPILRNAFESKKYEATNAFKERIKKAISEGGI